ncbi:MAG: 4-(cytidine 5'-diphospho)-2-C-methyl-D-erythritol kinase [Clostridium sp.]|nr:4-(cytidine 5'-diphospho)-2-C-methyl-D-erythritol kinase [Clostridium sp.]MCM1547386.1 4-(cytidine 5'-diphospho)-2-C-methyl-D-erythritol kinase [Ruminococcus sp.]
MNKITVKVSAKINLTLDVIGKRDDGYHDIESLFQSIGIYDRLTVEKLDVPEINITCSDPDVPCDKRNIVFKAAELFYKKTGIDGGVSVHIEKNIPLQAGLGGGSSDGAGVLYAMNKLYGTGLEGEKLTALGGEVSADTAFFTVGGTAYVSGIGEEINSVRFIPKVDLVIAKGGSGISTPEAYGKIDRLNDPYHPDTKKLLKYIEKGKFLRNCGLCGNIFESVTELRDVEDIKGEMLKGGALTSVMSGSGSAVFGIFRDKETAEKCADSLKRKYPFAEHCKTVHESILVEGFLNP